ncbi:hypothetical protein [Gelatiniphilus marinus]|uniref:Uncharacterized protein n=1 Tax=Gelatiniphilus marinus TaxID=1759464 RepID=A0ABW5JRK5_9FLAO
MRALKSILLTFVIAVSVFGCSNENLNQEIVSNLDPSEYYEELNISYGEDSDQKFDLYLPAN